MSDQESIFLDSLDGFEFEKLCARILHKLGYGEIEDVQDVADEGRDLIIHTRDGKTTVVECKHWPEGTVGRPVIQKLHSAVITSGANKGLLMTTGKLSKEALTHTKKLIPPIEVVDRGLLIDMATRAGIRLLSEGGELAVLAFPVSETEGIAKKLADQVYNRIESSPSAADNLFRLKPRPLNLQPAYLVFYNIDQDFSTSVGTIYSLHKKHEAIMLDGNKGTLVDRSVSSFLLEQQPKQLEQALPRHLCPHLPKFGLGTSSLNKLAKSLIIDIYTTNITYYGRNNRRYTMTCRPAERKIFIEDVKQICIPTWSIELTAVKRTYEASFLENPHGLLILHNDLFVCQICGRPIGGKILLCNSCGNVTHKPSLFWPHSFVCKLCKKTICKECAYQVRHWLLFKKIICEACADSVERQTYKPKRKLVSEGIK